MVSDCADICSQLPTWYMPPGDRFHLLLVVLNAIGLGQHVLPKLASRQLQLSQTLQTSHTCRGATFFL